MESKDIKEIVKNLGADLCGVAPVERFNEAPKGFHPQDIYIDSKSIVVYAKRLPVESLFATNCVPYTYVNNIITQKVDELGFEVALKLEDQGIKAIPIPSDDPYEYWEPENSYGRAILSLRHAGYLAGLGVLGKNTLLINKEFGNMIQIGAVLVPVELEGDTITTYEGCPTDCNLCIESCPVKALNGNTVDQKLCRPYSNYRTEKGYILKKCNVCRRICPNYLGIES
ncbi:MAG: epoxyqueuosine reductase [Thermoplasmata archaeon]|nr:MAG: epoxyqueuosine reductase [Thermoplasmata archaeon]